MPCKYLKSPYVSIYAGMSAVVPSVGFPPMKAVCAAAAAAIENCPVAQRLVFAQDGAELVVQPPDGLNNAFRLEIVYNDRGNRKVILINEVPSLEGVVESIKAVPDIHGEGRV